MNNRQFKFITEDPHSPLAGASPWKRYLYLWTIFPWWTSIALFGVSYVGYERTIAPELAPRFWSAPSTEQLTSVSVFLTASPMYYRSPYIFRTTGGQILSVFCHPNIDWNGCIAVAPSIVGRPATMTYFEVQGGPNYGRAVITSLAAGGRTIMDLADRRKELSEEAAIQDKTHDHTPLTTIIFELWSVFLVVLAMTGLSIKINSILANRGMVRAWDGGFSKGVIEASAAARAGKRQM